MGKGGRIRGSKIRSWSANVGKLDGSSFGDFSV